MDWLREAFHHFTHLDQTLGDLVRQYGAWSYGILFVIVFAETGLVVTPFLPGDSLLFAAGALAGLGSIRLDLAAGVLIVAAILGDTVNYWIGQYLGHRLLAWGRLIRKEHIDRTHAFFEKYGGKTIIIARFVPIVRTFAPFVAGVGEMTYSRFLAYNVIGALLWVFVCVGLGYLFGNLPLVKNNFSLVILAIIVISIMPAVIEFIRARRAAPRPAPEPVRD